MTDVDTLTHAFTEIGARAKLEFVDKPDRLNRSVVADVKKDGNGKSGDTIPISPNQNLPAVDLSKAGLPAALFGGLARHPLVKLKKVLISDRKFSPRDVNFILGIGRKFLGFFVGLINSFGLPRQVYPTHVWRIYPP